MKIYAETDEGVRVEIKAVAGIGEGDILIAKLDSIRLKPEHVEQMENALSKKTGKRVVILEPFIDVVGMIVGESEVYKPQYDTQTCYAPRSS